MAQDVCHNEFFSTNHIHMKLVKHTTLSSSNASGPTLLSDHVTVYYILNDVLNWLCGVYVNEMYSVVEHVFTIAYIHRLSFYAIVN